MRWREFLKRILCLLACCNSQIFAEKIPNWMGNHMRVNKEELLKKLYYDLKNPAAYAGKFKLLQEAKKHDANISIGDVEQWLKSQLAYTLIKPIRLNFKTRPVVVHQIDEQWQINLLDVSKLSKHNDGFKFIMVVIHILSKYAWLKPLKSKHGIAVKNASEHIFSETMTSKSHTNG